MILVVPIRLLSAIAGVWLVGSEVSIFTQIGFVLRVGLASRSASLIDEFAG